MPAFMSIAVRSKGTFLFILGGGRGPASAQGGFVAATGRGGGGGGGLGYAAGGRPAPKAMTSSMLSSLGPKTPGNGVQMKFSKAMGVTHSVPVVAIPSDAHPVATGGAIPGNTAANPYIEGQGMGRGKHLTKPSWSGPSDGPLAVMGSSSPPSSSSAASTTVPEQFEDAATSVLDRVQDPPVAQKRNRFSSLPPPDSAPAMAGFVRAAPAPSAGIAEVDSSVSTSFDPHKDGLPVKKSRWDK